MTRSDNRLPWLLALVGLSGLPTAAGATWSTNSTQNTPVVVQPGEQRKLAVAPDSLGGLLLTWQDRRSGTWRVYAQRLDHLGNPLWAANGVPVCPGTPDTASQGQFDSNTPPPQVVPDGIGGAFVAWVDARDSTSNGLDIYAQHLGPDGVLQWSLSGVAVSTASNDQAYMTASSDLANGMVLTWVDSRIGVPRQIYAQRLLSNGTSYWQAGGTPVSGTSASEQPVIVGVSSPYTQGPGFAIIAWPDNRNDTNGPWQAYANMLFPFQGTPTTDATGRALGNPKGQNNLAICRDDLGGAIVLWDDYTTSYPQGQVQLYAQRYTGLASSAGGSAIYWGANGVLITTTPVEGGRTRSIAPDGQHGAFIAWWSPSDGVYLQHLSSAGVTWPATVHVDSASVGPGRNQSIAPDGFGGVWVCWSANDGTHDHIYARRVNASGARIGPTMSIVSNAGGDQNNPVIAADGALGLMAAWSDTRSADADLYAQRLGPQGDLVDPPTITSVFPATGGPVGTTVDIFGSGLSAPFTLTLGGVPMAKDSLISPTHMQGQVPAAGVTGPIAISARAGSVASTGQFVVTTPGTYDGTFFRPPFTHLAQAGSPEAVVSADLDGDGRPDLVSANPYSRSVSIWLGNGDGTFGGRRDLFVYAADNVAVADLDGDGALDLVACGQNWSASDHHGDSLAVFRGHGDGTFDPLPKYFYVGGSIGLAVGSIYGGTLPDIVTASPSANPHGPIYVMRNRGGLDFDAPISYASGGGITSIVIADLNHDTHEDIAALDYDYYTVTEGNLHPSAITVLLNHGDGTFGPTPQIALADSGAFGIAVGDMNGDGKPDLVTATLVASGTDPSSSATLYKGNVLEFMNDGAGGFNTAAPLRTPCASYGFGVVVHDFNGDGVLDVALGHILQKTAGILANDGAGNLSPEVLTTDPGLDGYGLTVADLNADGRPDLISADGTLGGQVGGSGSQDVTVMMGRPIDDLTCPPFLASPVVGTPSAVTVSDFDGDRHPDAVAIVRSAVRPDSAVFLRNTGADTHGHVRLTPTASRFVVLGGASSIVPLDLKRDGKMDLVVGAETSFGVYLSDGAGGFVADAGYPVTAAAVLVANVDTVDFLRNGYPGVVAIDSAGQMVRLFSSGSSGQLTGQDAIPVNGVNAALAVADMDGDGWPDLVVGTTVAGQSSVMVLHNDQGQRDGSGHFFTPRQPLPLRGHPQALAIADVDGDHKPDVVTSFRDRARISLVRGLGDGTFTSEDTTASMPGPAPALAVADFNGDGWQDVVAADAATGRVAYLLNDRGGHLQPAREYGGVPIGVGVIAVADVNGDGRPDVVGTDVLRNAIDIYPNAAIFSPGNWQPLGTTTVSGMDELLNPLSSPDGALGQYVTWAERTPPGDWNVSIQHLVASGAVAPGWPSGGLRVCNASGNQVPTALVPDSTTTGSSGSIEGAIVVWSDARDSLAGGGGKALDVYSQRVGDLGSGPIVYWASNGQPVIAGAGMQDESQAASDGSHGAIVAWRDSSSAGPAANSVVEQRLDASGASRFGVTGSVVAGGLSGHPTPVITPDGKKGTTVGWRQTTSSRPPGAHSISSTTDIVKLARVDSSGTRLWTTTVAGAIVGGRQDLQIVGDGAQGAIMSWADSRASDLDVYAQRVDGGGVPQWTSEGVLVAGGTGDQSQVTMSSAPGNDAYIAWTDGRNPVLPAIYAQRVALNGAAIWTANGVPAVSAPGGAQATPASTTDSNGGLMLLWQQDAGAGSTQIAASRLTSGGTHPAGWSAGGLQLTTGVGKRDTPRLVGDFAGGAIGTWRSSNLDTSSIQAARISGNGVVVLGVHDVAPPRVERMSLSLPRPNPSRAEVSFTLTLPRRMQVEVEAYDVQGRRVATLVPASEFAAGEHLLRWQAPVSAGLYFVRARSGTETQIRRIVRLR